ncbi:MAG: ric [Fibrobacteres bacterium]|nr:ric [Fibrobacterota bacterium]
MEHGIEKESAPIRKALREIEAVHQAYVASARPRLTALAAKVARVHGIRHPELEDLAETVDHLFQVLEPSHRAGNREGVGVLESIRTLTSGYNPPGDACDSYLSLFQGLERMEAEILGHFEKEDAILQSREPDIQGPEPEPKDRPGSCCGM